MELLHTETINKMIKIKKETGYIAEDFEREYWLATPDWGDIPARIDKDYSYVIKFFKDLFLKIGVMGNILDVGAGAGACVNAFRGAGIESYGCEFSFSGREIAKERFCIDLDACDLREKLPYVDSAFDFSCCLGVLSMIPKNKMENAVAEILRVTKYIVLINVGTAIADGTPAERYNPHHLTAMSSFDYWKILQKCGARDLTSIQPPQKSNYGIGIAGEFCGIFSKNNIYK